MEFTSRNWENAIFAMVDRNHRNRAGEHNTPEEIVIDAVEPDHKITAAMAAVSLGTVVASAVLFCIGAPVWLLVTSSALFAGICIGGVKNG